MIIQGAVWKFGDNVDTDVIIPAPYLVTTDSTELGKHCMETVDPGFSQKVRPGDIYRSAGDPSLSKKILGFIPQVDLETGLGITAAWMERSRAV